MFRAKTGLLARPYFSATKIAWMLENVEGARAQAEAGKLAFGTVDSWLIWNLTGGQRHVTDRTNASRTLLYNIVEDRWDEELLRILSIPASMMPEVVWSSEKIGGVTTTLGLGDVAICGDRRRPAGGAVWAALYQARRCEMHLWHGMLSAAEHWRQVSCSRGSGW